MHAKQLQPQGYQANSLWLLGMASYCYLLLLMKIDHKPYPNTYSLYKWTRADISLDYFRPGQSHS